MTLEQDDAETIARKLRQRRVKRPAGWAARNAEIGAREKALAAAQGR